MRRVGLFKAISRANSHIRYWKYRRKIGKNVIFVSDSEWDKLVNETYGKPYELQQQQNDCYENGSRIEFEVPFSSSEPYSKFENATLPYEINGEKMGVSLESWVATDEDSFPYGYKYEKDLWYGRNFYPHYEEIANDLYNKGLLQAGNYVIDISW